MVTIIKRLLASQTFYCENKSRLMLGNILPDVTSVWHGCEMYAGRASQALLDATRHNLTQPGAGCHGNLQNGTCHWNVHFTYFIAIIRCVPHGATRYTLHLYTATTLSQVFYRGHLGSSSSVDGASVSHASSLM